MKNFCIAKHNLFNIANQLRPLVIKQDKKHRKYIPIEIQVCCAIYKLAHGSNFFTYSELFAIGKSTMSFASCEFVFVVNEAYQDLITWPKGRVKAIIMEEFRL